MLKRSLFSALPKASEDLLSVHRETGKAFHVAGPQQWNPRCWCLSWGPTADQRQQNWAVDVLVVCRRGCRRQPDKAALSRSHTCGPTSPPCMRCAWLQVANANSAIQAWCGQIIMPHQIIRSWYIGHWWMSRYIWYSEERPGRAPAPPSPLLTVPHVTAHPSTASVPITVLLYDGPLLCSFNVAIKGLKILKSIFVIFVTFIYFYDRCQKLYKSVSAFYIWMLKQSGLSFWATLYMRSSTDSSGVNATVTSIM